MQGDVGGPNRALVVIYFNFVPALYQRDFKF